MGLLWNSDYALGRFLNRIGAIRRGGEVLAPCPLFDEKHPPKSNDPYKVVLSRGHTQPLLFHCRVCGRSGHEDIVERWGLSGRKETLRWFAEADRANYKPLEEVEETEPLLPPLRVLDAAYTAALVASPVAADDKASRWLRERGIDGDFAAELQYGYFPADLDSRRRIRESVAESLKAQRIDVDLSLIPGLFHADDLRGPAVAIPSRAESGEIQGIKLRLLDGGKQRMRQLSSRASGGVPAVNRLHFASQPRGGDLYLTEGERKADLLQRLRVKESGCAVAVPGTDNRRLLYEWVEERRFKWDRILLAFDADWAGIQCGREVAAVLSRTTTVVGETQGFAVSLLTWKGFKGIDDALIGGAEIREATAPSPTTVVGLPTAASIVARISLEDAVGREPWKLSDFDVAFPALKQQLRSAIASKRVEFRKYVGVGPVVASLDTPEERWQSAVKSLSVAALSSS